MTSEEIPEGVHPYEYAEGEAREPIKAANADVSDTTEKVLRDRTWREAFCEQ